MSWGTGGALLLETEAPTFVIEVNLRFALELAAKEGEEFAAKSVEPARAALASAQPEERATLCRNLARCLWAYGETQEQEEPLEEAVALFGEAVKLTASTEPEQAAEDWAAKATCVTWIARLRKTDAAAFKRAIKSIEEAFDFATAHVLKDHQYQSLHNAGMAFADHARLTGDLESWTSSATSFENAATQFQGEEKAVVRQRCQLKFWAGRSYLERGKREPTGEVARVTLNKAVALFHHVADIVEEKIGPDDRLVGDARFYAAVGYQARALAAYEPKDWVIAFNMATKAIECANPSSLPFAHARRAEIGNLVAEKMAQDLKEKAEAEQPPSVLEGAPDADILFWRQRAVADAERAQRCEGVPASLVLASRDIALRAAAAFAWSVSWAAHKWRGAPHLTLLRELASEVEASGLPVPAKRLREFAQGLRESLRVIGKDEIDDINRRVRSRDGGPAATKFDKPSSSVPSKKDDTEQQEGRIADDPAAVETTVDAGEDFAGAVGALKSRLVPTVTDQDIAELEAVIREAQQNPPEDRAAFVADINRVLEAGGLRLEMDDGKLARLKHGFGGSIQFGVPGASRGFRKASFQVVRVTDTGRKSAVEAGQEAPQATPQ